jgi:outer membrane lipoprotein-sorting protein
MWKIAGTLGTVGLLTLLVFVRASEDARLRELVERAIKAHGGPDVLAKYKAGASKEKGKIHLPGQAIDFTGETSYQLPDRIRSDAHFKAGGQEFTVIQVIDGKKGWFKVGDKTEEMNKEMLDEAREQINVAKITHLIYLQDKDYKLSPLGEAKVGGRPAIGVRVERKGYRDVNLFFDKDKGLLLKMETRSKDLMQGGQEYTSTTLYDDYKKVEGMMVPYKVTIERDGKPYVDAEVTEAKIAEKIDDNVFEKP